MVIAISRNAIKPTDLPILPGESEKIVSTNPINAGAGGIQFNRGADGNLELNFNAQ